MKKTLLFSILFSLSFLYSFSQERIWYRDAEVAGHVANLQTLSNKDVDGLSEQALRVALEDVRIDASFKDKWQVTTYTYDPLIGVTSITDPRGETIYYEYDEFNRLEFVKDADGNILSKNQ